MNSVYESIDEMENEFRQQVRKPLFSYISTCRNDLFLRSQYEMQKPRPLPSLLALNDRSVMILCEEE